VFIYFLLNLSKHNTNEICIITFNGALVHVSAPESHHQAKYNKPIDDQVEGQRPNPIGCCASVFWAGL
jgi:hypothetical protein